MDHTDVEAATDRDNAAQDMIVGESNEAQRDRTRYSLIRTLAGDDTRHESVQRIASTLADRLIGYLNIFVREELHNPEVPLQLIVPESSERDAVAGAVETTSGLHVQDGGKLDKEHDNGDKQHQKELCSQSSPVTVKVPNVETENSRIDGTFKQKGHQDATQSPKPIMEYMKGVVRMTEQDIETQNMSRRSLRDRWRAGKDLSYLEDPWKHLWRRNQSDAELLFRRCTDEERRGLQPDLIDALFFIPNDRHLDLIPWRGLRALSCWVSLIGLRITDICGRASHAFNDEPTGIDNCVASIHIRILIECIWICNTCSNSRVGDVLTACYKRGVLRQPRFGPGSICNQALFKLRIQIKLVHIAIYLVNILFKHKPPDQLRLFAHGTNPEEAWFMPISLAEQSMRQAPTVCDAGREPFLAVSDLNLRDLQKFGKLRIQWTSYWDEHLEVEIKRSVAVLKLYWFPVGLSEIFSTT
ncbi:MAG: hypothetical protein Q9168_002935 [Polycauliona sp. 1 TL-2023]